MKGINMLKLIELLKLNQPSTWRGLIGLLSGLGVAISPELAEHIVALAVSAFGIVEIVRSEKIPTNEKSIDCNNAIYECTPLISDNGRFFFCIKNTYQRLCRKDISPNNIFPYSYFFWYYRSI